MKQLNWLEYCIYCSILAFIGWSIIGIFLVLLYFLGTQNYSI